MVLLVIVMAVVLILVAKSWKTVAPAALDTQDALSSVNDRGQPEAAAAARQGGMPGLGETQDQTDQHSAQVQEALDAIE